MNKTKDQQAQEYATNKLRAFSEGTLCPYDDIADYFDFYDVKEAYIDGYTACEQSMWRSVEDELPEEDGMYLVCTEDGNVETVPWDEAWLICGHVVSYWMPIPSLPDTNTIT